MRKSNKKTRDAGKYRLMSLEDYNNCFYFTFGIYPQMCARYTEDQVLYIYGMRKLCGFTHHKIVEAFGGNIGLIVVQKSIRLAISIQCNVSAKYNPSFKADRIRLWGVCNPFRRIISNAESQAKFQAKKRAEKLAKAKSTQKTEKRLKIFVNNQI